MLLFEKSRSGHRVPIVDGKALISRFDPEKDALRFIKNSCNTEIPHTLVIIGDVLGYLGKAARSLYSGAEIIGISQSRELLDQNSMYNRQWSGEIHDFPRFLDSALTEDNISGLKLIEWQASTRAFPSFSAEIMHLLQRRIRILNGNITTTRAFGSRWIRNTLFNFMYIPRFTRLVEASPGFAVIAASGASLSSSRDLLSRKDVTLFALPSSLRYLNSIGRKADVIVQTDPGYFAEYHLREGINRSPVIAAPLLACPFITRSGADIMPLNYGDPLEKRLFKESGIESYRLPSTGTVAAAALAAAVAMGASPAGIAGLDLCYDDINTHVRPHSFDEVFFSGKNRAHPAYSAKFRYSRDTDLSRGQSPALHTYEKWFEGIDGDFRSRILRIHPSRVSLPVKSLNINNKNIIDGPFLKLKFALADTPDFHERKKLLIHILKHIQQETSTDPDSPLSRELRAKLGTPDTFTETFSKITAWISLLEAP